MNLPGEGNIAILFVKQTKTILLKNFVFLKNKGGGQMEGKNIKRKENEEKDKREEKDGRE